MADRIEEVSQRFAEKIANKYIDTSVGTDALEKYIIEEFRPAVAEILEGERKKLVERMTQRFLCWKLPKDFNPDAGISYNPRWEWESAHWPVGTNLFSADQAKQMIEYMLADQRDSQPTEETWECANCSMINRHSRRSCAGCGKAIEKADTQRESEG